MVKEQDFSQETLDSAVAEGNAYELLQKRLTEQGRQLHHYADFLNEKRIEEFGQSQNTLSGRIRIRTENNCQSRDIVRVGNWLLFGYNVFMGLKKQTQISDVFSLYQIIEQDSHFDAEIVPTENTFLDDPSFVLDFNELYTYYKNTHFLQFSIQDGKLLASFQIGDKISDIRVFRWSLSPDKQKINYIDNRGERDLKLPPSSDFDWIKTTREDFVNGRYPHVNIIDTLFIETIGGDLTIKTENNTEDGLGIYREAVMDKTQSLDDAKIEYALVGSLILLKVLPYREDKWRYLIFNKLTEQVVRLDELGLACIQLPEDHGIIFPGGYYLQDGEHKKFDFSMAGMRFRQIRRSPNGEDVLYVFYEPVGGKFALFNYNLIERELSTPILGHGYAMYENGRMVLFENNNEETTRIHPMQIWQTPYYSDFFAAQLPTRNSFWGRIGNAELVRSISDLYHLAKECLGNTVSLTRYEQLIQVTRRLVDAYFWFEQVSEKNILQTLKELISTGELILDEYEKVESIRLQSTQSMADLLQSYKQFISTLLPDSWDNTQQFIDGLQGLSALQGKTITLKSYRYIDMDKLNELEADLSQRYHQLSQQTAAFLSQEQAFQIFSKKIHDIEQQTHQAKTSVEFNQPFADIEKMVHDLDMLSQLVSNLQFDDPIVQTQIIDCISQIYAQLNQVRARLTQQRKALTSNEAIAQFSSQFKLFNQSVESALSLVSRPDQCDASLSRLLLQLEEFESHFSEYDEFLQDILAKREETIELFEKQKQTFLDEQQRRAQNIISAADRILSGITNRTARLKNLDELNTFFATDGLIVKLNELATRLRDLNEQVKADDIVSQLKNSKDLAIRTLRDKSELFEAEGKIIKLGHRHRFSVNTQQVDLTLLPKKDQLYLVVTGTDYQQPIDDVTLNQLKSHWQTSVESESTQVSRAEFLAYRVYETAQKEQDNLTLSTLSAQLATPEQLANSVREFALQHYKEGYERGIHDHDASLILQQLLPVIDQANLLKFNPLARAMGMLFWWQYQDKSSVKHWPYRAQSSLDIKQLFGHQDAFIQLQNDIEQEVDSFCKQHQFILEKNILSQTAEFLATSLSQSSMVFPFSKYADQLIKTLELTLTSHNKWLDFTQSLYDDASNLTHRWHLAIHWLSALCQSETYQPLRGFIYEAAANLILLQQNRLMLQLSEADLMFTVSGLLSQHSTIEQGSLTLRLDDYFSRMHQHESQFIPEFQQYQQLRQQFLQQQRQQFKLAQFMAQPLSSFVRNKLINEVYLPLIGDNLAKQIGDASEAKRTDLMGLLLLISPPGYGKTTLMEYIANRLGLIFVKVNGPALGHSIHSLDPHQAPNMTARQELEKLNFAFEMANNVMLYIDDIQHTHPEFLQKFISLCDGSRRIEGVWQGQSKTYNLRGKRFCIIMAGNPYTESGEVFKIPDMLANRADVYNLGEVLGGMEDLFSLSYIENCLTSNSILAPLALRDLSDLYQLIDCAMGLPFNPSTLKHHYGQAELNEITTILKHLIKLKATVFDVNQHYILSAAQDDKYRTEPAFKLQGSYRNMNKMAEKISAVMNDRELEQLLDDHYRSEAQLLTSGAEENLLKLADIRHKLTPEQQQRWKMIKENFIHHQKSSGQAVGEQVVERLGDLVQSVQALGKF